MKTVTWSVLPPRNHKGAHWMYNCGADRHVIARDFGGDAAPQGLQPHCHMANGIYKTGPLRRACVNPCGVACPWSYQLCMYDVYVYLLRSLVHWLERRSP
jgi:hypothetical protein